MLSLPLSLLPSRLVIIKHIGTLSQGGQGHIIGCETFGTMYLSRVYIQRFFLLVKWNFFITNFDCFNFLFCFEYFATDIEKYSFVIKALCTTKQYLYKRKYLTSIGTCYWEKFVQLFKANQGSSNLSSNNFFFCIFFCFNLIFVNIL